MKLLFMTNIPAPYRVLFFNQLAKKVDLTVLFENRNDKERNEEWYKNNQYLFHAVFLPRKKRLKTLFSLLKENYDFIIMGTYATKISAIARFYFKHKKIKYAISADGGFIQDQYFITKWIKTFFIRSASYWLSSGKETTKYLTYYGANIEQVYEYHFTSLTQEDILKKPLSYEEKLKLRKKAGYNYKTIFLSVGQLVYRKGYDLLLDIVKENSFSNDVAFLIAGVGAKQEEYQQFLKDYKIKNVYFVGFKDKKEIIEYYKMADVFFFPSREDIWGLVINEAMACGLPVISSNKTLAALELLKKDYLFNVDNKEGLQNKLYEMNQKSKKELNQIGNENLNIIQKYTMEQMVEDHLNFLKELKIAVDHEK